VKLAAGIPETDSMYSGILTLLEDRGLVTVADGTGWRLTEAGRAILEAK
jgi:Mn-dependent DtxR family transcriptional regulator